MNIFRNKLIKFIGILLILYFAVIHNNQNKEDHISAIIKDKIIGDKNKNDTSKEKNERLVSCGDHVEIVYDIKQETIVKSFIIGSKKIKFENDLIGAKIGEIKFANIEIDNKQYGIDIAISRIIDHQEGYTCN